jgi:hypothetical protein
MPNQMIALQSRGAKMPDPTAQTAKFVNMMNMAKQQEAAAASSMRWRSNRWLTQTLTKPAEQICTALRLKKPS